jgi:hypothetical protein
MDDQTNLMDKYPLETYEYFLLGPMTKIYARRSKKTDWERHANLLIDKFAIHSSTLFHVMQGMIEHKGSSLNRKKMAYDPFSVNVLIRVIIETYIAFHHIFISTKDKDEIRLRFQLWQLDGLLEKRKFRVENSDFLEAETILKQDAKRIEYLCIEIEQNNFFNKFPKTEQLKIYESTNTRKKVAWKFNISNDFKIRPLQIIQLVEQICPTRAFVNTYKYSSIHTHSGYLAIEHFENVRGKEVPTEQKEPIIKIAIYLTVFLITDMCNSDEQARKEFENLPTGIQDIINGINNSFRNNS